MRLPHFTSITKTNYVFKSNIFNINDNFWLMRGKHFLYGIVLMVQGIVLVILVIHLAMHLLFSWYWSQVICIVVFLMWFNTKSYPIKQPQNTCWLVSQKPIWNKHQYKWIYKHQSKYLNLPICNWYVNNDTIPQKQALPQPKTTVQT